MKKNKFWSIKAKNGSADTGELYLYGEISSYTWYGDEVTPKQFKADLDALGDIKYLNIYTNSGGGDVFAGMAIYNMLKRHTAYKTAYVDGIAASIASVIIMSADKIIMPSNAMLMVHNAATYVYANKQELRKIADDLEKVDESIKTTYAEKTGLKSEEITAFMDAETWFTAAEAVEKGFADKIEAEKKVAASINGNVLTINEQKFDLEKYKNAPKIDIISQKPNNSQALALLKLQLEL